MTASFSFPNLTHYTLYTDTDNLNTVSLFSKTSALFDKIVQISIAQVADSLVEASETSVLSD